MEWDVSVHLEQQDGLGRIQSMKKTNNLFFFFFFNQQQHSWVVFLFLMRNITKIQFYFFFKFVLLNVGSWLHSINTVKQPING